MIQRLWIVIQRLRIAIQRLWIAIQRLWIVIQRLWIVIQRLWIAIQRDFHALGSLSIAIDPISQLAALRNGSHSLNFHPLPRRICAVMVHLGRKGRRARRICASSGVFQPLRRLH